MYISGHKIILSLVMIVVETHAKDVVSEEIKDDKFLRNAKNTFSIDRVERRFFDNLNDEEWHVAHLRDTDFKPIKSGCKEETFEEKTKRYRKSLKRDGSLVEFVSADPLPFNEKDLAVDVCRIPDVVDRVFKTNKNSTAKDGKEDKAKKIEEPRKEQVDTATTHGSKKREGSSKDGKRRASEYQFTSNEYYDEVEEINFNQCPDDLEEIVLEIEHIREYDVQCELMLEWRSLESIKEDRH